MPTPLSGIMLGFLCCSIKTNECGTVNSLFNQPIFHLKTPHWEVEIGFHSCLCRPPVRVPE